MLRPLVVSEFISTSFTYLLFSPLFSVSRSNGPLDTEKSEGLVYNQGAIIWQQQWPREECHSLTFPTYILHMSSSTFHEPRTPLCRCGGIKNLAFRQTVLKSFVRNDLRAKVDVILITACPFRSPRRVPILHLPQGPKEATELLSLCMKPQSSQRPLPPKVLIVALTSSQEELLHGSPEIFQPLFGSGTMNRGKPNYN